MNQRIDSYGDYLNELKHQFAISTGQRQRELRKLILKEIAEKYEYDHPRVKVEVNHDHDYDFIEECHQRDLMNEKYESDRYCSITNN